MAFQTTLQTMMTFFLLLAVGFVAGKAGVIRREFMGALSQLITKVFLPVMIFYFTVSTVTLEMMADNLVLIPIAVLVYLALIVCSFLVAKIMRLPHDKDRIFQFAFIFGNTGFVGFPLLKAVFPETGMLFMCLFNLVDQLIFWTYGIWLSTARDRQTARFNPRMLLSPNVIAIVLSLVFIGTGIPLPDLLDSALGSIGTATSPLCLMYLGAMVCFNNLAVALKRPETYVEIALKMIALPICAGWIARFFGASADIVGCIALFVALPVMTVVPMISAQNGNEGEYATGMAVCTFVACVATIPLVAFCAL